MNRIQLSSILRAAIIGAFLPVVVQAQSGFHGTLVGSVSDAAGRPIYAADIRITDRVSEAERQLSTGRDGRFHVGLLNPGTYDIAIEALGYRPLRYLGVVVTAGSTARARLILRADTPPITRIDTVRATNARSAPLAWLSERGYAELAGGRRLATDAAALSTTADAFTVEGLPWRYADLMVDGARLAPLTLPADNGSATTALALPMRGLGDVGVGGMGFDVEAGGTGVGLNALSLRGGGVASSRGALFGGTSDLGGALIAGGPIQRDTASAIIGVDYQRAEVTTPAWFPQDDAAGLALLATARDTYGTDLSPYATETPRLEERASGFGRLDWQLGDRYAISLRAAGSRLVVGDQPFFGGMAASLGTRYEATAAQFGLDVLARINKRMSGEVRLSGDVAQASSEQATFASTAFAGRGLTLGGLGAEPFRDELATPRVTAMLHWDLGAHRLKLGTAFATSRTESQGTGGAAGSFAFGDGADFAAGQGAWRGLTGNASSGNFSLTETALFAQDTWTVTEGLTVNFGLRLDAQRIGLGTLDQNALWVARTGLDNAGIRESRARAAPRIGFRWLLGDTREWVIDGGAGIYNGLPDRRDVGDALALDQGIEVRSALGVLGGWPAAPGAGVAPVRGRTIALLGPGLEGPRTRRMTFGVLRQFGDWSAYARGTYRQTDYLSRRRDLNLPMAPTGTDQYGRPLYGALQQVGALVAAAPGSNRRFPEFDAATAIELTGYSEFWAATLGIERVVEQGISAGVHYTVSQTRDNLVGGLPLAPLPLGADGGEWGDARSDFDVPRRLLAAAEWSANANGSFRIGGVLRVNAATPFGAGFRAGVDANGDGIAGNDPAIVDAALPGMDALLTEHDCLRSAVGTYVTRNGCRGESTFRLDLRASVRIASFGASPLDLVVDAIDVMSSEQGPVDQALYLVDRTGTLTTNPGTGVTTVPLVVNPNFGALLADRAPGILFRVGLRIGR